MLLPELHLRKLCQRPFQKPFITMMCGVPCNFPIKFWFSIVNLICTVSIYWIMIFTLWSFTFWLWAVLKTPKAFSSKLKREKRTERTWNTFRVVIIVLIFVDACMSDPSVVKWANQISSKCKSHFILGSSLETYSSNFYM